MEKVTTFKPAFHKIHEDPKQNYGVGALQCMMSLRGELGAITFVFSTGMYLDETIKYWLDNNLKYDNRPMIFSDGSVGGMDYMGYDVGYHSPKPLHEWQESYSQEKCEHLNGRPCFSDGSALRSDEWMKVLIREGSGKIWSMMEEDYKERFGELK